MQRGVRDFSQIDDDEVEECEDHQQHQQEEAKERMPSSTYLATSPVEVTSTPPHRSVSPVMWEEQDVASPKTLMSYLSHDRHEYHRTAARDLLGEDGDEAKLDSPSMIDDAHDCDEKEPPRPPSLNRAPDMAVELSYLREAVPVTPAAIVASIPTRPHVHEGGVSPPKGVTVQGADDLLSGESWLASSLASVTAM
jgi:hypothetical protein